MSAELKVVLVGDNPEQQKAFNDPQSVAQSKQTAPPVQSSAEKDSADQTSRAKSLLESPEIGSVQELTDAIGKLVEQMIREQDKQKTAPEAGEDPKTQGLLARLGSSLQSALNRTGLPKTRIGKRVGAAVTSASRRASSLGKSFAKTRVGAGLARAGGAVAARLGLGAAGAGTAGAGGAAAGAGAAAVGAVGAIAVPAAAAAAALAVVAVSVKSFSDALHNVASELEEFSPAIATARAQFDANRQIATLDRAQRVGAELAQLDVARYRLSESMYEVQTKILEILVKAAPFIEGILDAANAGVRGIEAQIALINYIWSIVNNLPQLGLQLGDDKKAFDDLRDSMSNLKDAVKQVFQDDQSKFGGIDPFFQSILNLDITLKKPQAPNVLGGQFP